MIVRIRFGPRLQRDPQDPQSRRVASAMGSLLVPIAVMACVLGVWRLAADFKMAEDFAIDNGIFSHWQVWIASGVVLALAARFLNRYGLREDPAASTSQ